MTLWLLDKLLNFISKKAAKAAASEVALAAALEERARIAKEKAIRAEKIATKVDELI